MKKERKIAFRVTEQEEAYIKKEAEKSGETVSNYVRLCMKKNITDNWITKTEVQQHLSRIITSLDMKEEKYSRVTAPMSTLGNS